MRVTLYIRPDCPLCDELKADLLQMQTEVGFSLFEQNIEDDVMAYERFRYLIPVLDIENGPLLCPPHAWNVTYAAIVQASAESAHR